MSLMLKIINQLFLTLDLRHKKKGVLIAPFFNILSYTYFLVILQSMLLVDTSPEEFIDVDSDDTQS